MYLYGASGHAKVVIDILRANGKEVTALVDDNESISKLAGVPVLHDAKGLSPFIVSIGNCQIRKKIVERLGAGVEFATAVHPSALISPSATIGEGTVVMHGAIVQADAHIGRHCIINTKASIDHECVVGDYVHIAPGCTISGDVKIGEGSWIGVGATIIQGVTIGRNCFIGAGSVVLRDVPDGAKGYGVPFRLKTVIDVETAD